MFIVVTELRRLRCQSFNNYNINKGSIKQNFSDIELYLMSYKKAHLISGGKLKSDYY